MPSELITTSPKHTKHTFSYAASMTFYKLSYYGWRSILVLLLFAEIDESSFLEFNDFLIYLSIGFAGAYLLGGILGDLLIGNKLAAYLGGGFMFIGSLLFFIHSSMSPEIPIVLFVIGCGLYQSNLKALYAKLYLHDKRLLDSGFMILYLFINLGSFLGTILIGLVEYYYGIEFGFLAVSVFTILSISMLAITREPSQVPNDSIPVQKSFFNKLNLKPILFVLGAYILCTFFWKLTYSEMYVQYWEINIAGYVSPLAGLDTLNALMYMIIGVYLAVLWSKKYYNHLTKLTTSIVLMLLVFSVSFFSFNEGSMTTTVVTFLAVLIYAFANLLIEPFVDSYIAKLVNRRFLAIAYGAISFIFMGFGYIAIYAEKGLDLLLRGKTIYAGLGGFLLLSLILVIQVRKSRRAQ